METLIAALMGLFFRIDNDAFFERVDELKAQGAKWEYVGYKEVDPDKIGPSLLINEETNPHVYWVLRTPK